MLFTVLGVSGFALFFAFHQTRRVRRPKLIGAIISALKAAAAIIFAAAIQAPSALAQSHQPGGEANLRLPDLSTVPFLGTNGHTLLLLGLVVCFLGLMFGLAIYMHLKNLPVHRAMREISEL